MISRSHDSISFVNDGDSPIKTMIRGWCPATSVDILVVLRVRPGLGRYIPRYLGMLGC